MTAIVFAILILILLGWIAFLLRLALIQYRDMKLSMQQQDRDKMINVNWTASSKNPGFGNGTQTGTFTRKHRLKIVK